MIPQYNIYHNIILLGAAFSQKGGCIYQFPINIII
jgi:hypothetical protein